MDQGQEMIVTNLVNLLHWSWIPFLCLVEQSSIIELVGCEC